MKNIFFASLMLLFVACGGNNDKAAKAETESIATEKKYACPMHCEGEKTYAEAGKCPVCKMDLQEVAMAKTDSTEHNH